MRQLRCYPAVTLPILCGRWISPSSTASRFRIIWGATSKRTAPPAPPRRASGSWQVTIHPFHCFTSSLWCLYCWLTGLKESAATNGSERETFYIEAMRSFSKSPAKERKRFTGGLFHVSQLPGRAASQVGMMQDYIRIVHHWDSFWIWLIFREPIWRRVLRTCWKNWLSRLTEVSSKTISKSPGMRRADQSASSKTGRIWLTIRTWVIRRFWRKTREFTPTFWCWPSDAPPSSQTRQKVLKIIWKTSIVSNSNSLDCYYRWNANSYWLERIFFRFGSRCYPLHLHRRVPSGHFRSLVSESSVANRSAVSAVETDWSNKSSVQRRR